MSSIVRLLRSCAGLAVAFVVPAFSLVLLPLALAFPTAPALAQTVAPPAAVSPAPAPVQSVAPDPAQTPAPVIEDRPGRERRPNYALTIEAPPELVQLIERQTLIGRWRFRPEYDAGQFEALFDRIPQEVDDVLRAQGYFDGQTRVEGDANAVRVIVTAGARSTVNRVTLSIKGPVTDEPTILRRAQQGFALPEGSFYTAANWDVSKRDLVEGLRQRGYLRARIVESRATADVVNTTVGLDVVVESGPRIRYGALQIKGLERYQASVVENLRPFAPGQPYSFEEMLLFQTRLRDAGYFSNAYVLPDLAALEADPDALRVPIIVDVAERMIKRVILGVGYSTDQGARVQIGFEHRNLLERGWQLQSGLILEQSRQRLFGTVTTPAEVTGHFYSFGGRIERQDLVGERTDKNTVFVGRGRRTERIEYFTSLQFQTENRDVDQVGGGVVSDSRKALTLGYSWNYRNLDSRIDPRQGYTLSAQISGATRALLTDRSFVRLYTRAMRFWPLDKEFPNRSGVVVGLLELGTVLARSRDDIPSENLFRAGGAQSVRGYRYQSLGVVEGSAIVGGRFLAVGSLEYQHPFTTTLYGAAFVDAGNAVDRRQDFKALLGYGVGLRWRTPIGPINIDAAYGQEVAQWRLHMSVGYTF